MYRGMHHPTDVAGAVILSTLLLTLVYWIVRPNADMAAVPKVPGQPATGPVGSEVEGDS
jgi:membrane-associated phospholipid phosphatase